MIDEEGNKEILKALVKAQLEIEAPEKDKENPRFKSSYSSLDSIYTAIRRPLAKNGLMLSHTVENDSGKMMLVTIIRHVSGQEISCRMPMFIEAQTSQGFGSALTYIRRYSICSLLGLPSEDDDGELATHEQKGPKTNPKAFSEELLSENQIDEIFNLADGDDEILARLEKMVNAYKKSDISQIEAKHFPSICLKIREAKKLRAK